MLYVTERTHTYDFLQSYTCHFIHIPWKTSMTLGCFFVFKLKEQTWIYTNIILLHTGICSEIKVARGLMVKAKNEDWSCPSPSGFTEDLKYLSLGCSEGRTPKDFSVCVATPTWCTSTQHRHTSALSYTLWITCIYSPCTNLTKPFWFSARHRCSPLHQFQKVANSWVSAQLQLFNNCVQNNTISLIKSTLHCRVTSPPIYSYIIL